MTPGAASSLVPAMLREYGDVTRVALCDYLRPRAPQRHLYSLVADYPRRGGRMLRPSLCIATARAFGAELEDAVHAVGVAVNVGDALVLLGLRALIDGGRKLGRRLGARVLEEAERMVRESI